MPAHLSWCLFARPVLPTGTKRPLRCLAVSSRQMTLRGVAYLTYVPFPSTPLQAMHAGRELHQHVRV
jgi:hypothetical protein